MMSKLGFDVPGYINDPAREHDYVILIDMRTMRCNSNPREWQDRTLKTAHEFIIDNFYKINYGAMIDVRKILKERESNYYDVE